jgi:hypothetical protein
MRVVRRAFVAAAGALALAALAGCAATTTKPLSAELRQALAPTGALRDGRCQWRGRDRRRPARARVGDACARCG